jgi:hypothetical protein
LGQIVWETPISKITRAKWDWKCGSSGRVPALQMRSPEFKPHYQKKKEKKRKKRKKEQVPIDTSLLTKEV